MKKINVGVIGYGIVGKGTVETLLSNRQIILDKTGIDITLFGVSDLNIDKKTDEFLDKVPFTTANAMDLVSHPDVDIVVELVGGYTYAKDFIMAAIKNGKHVVTANKALLAVHGKEIFDLAKANRVEVAFEASVGGGIPIIKVIKEDLAANNITQIEAIINGTSNYILSRMQSEGKDYADILKDAQALGYAESDPTFDVQGIDSAHKLTVLSSLAFGSWVDFDSVYVEGITSISAVDINFAKELGCVIKLLAIAKRDNDALEVRVHPTMIPHNYQLASVNGVFNAVQVTGDMVGTTLHQGRGAGGAPTSSAVVGDIISISRNITFGCVGRVPLLGYVNSQPKLKVKSIDKILSSFYLRFTVSDDAGVMATIASILSKNDISIGSAIQKKPTSNVDDNSVPLVMMTHETVGANIFNAVKEIDELPFTTEKTVIIRVQGIK